MNLSGIISIAGRPGLFKVVAQGKNNVIVESLGDGKRFPAYSSDRISALDDISVYTYDQDRPLREILRAIYDKENGQETISQKESDAKLIEYILEIVPNYDQERVYVSDIKKIFQWYNLLFKSGQLKLKEEVIESEAKEVASSDNDDIESVKAVKSKKKAVVTEK